MSVLASAAVLAGCGGTTGERASRLTPTQGVPDAGGDGVIEPPFVCGPAMTTFDCSKPFMLSADGHITDFSNREWNNNGGKSCDAGGFHGSIYGYTNPDFKQDTHVQTVPDGSFHLALNVTGTQYGGGGLAFEGGCLDLSAFTGIQFSVAVVSGSLASCPLQIQLQTFDARPTDQNPPGGCDKATTSCFAFPAVTSLPTISTDPANPTLISLPFTSFSRIAGTNALTQIVGIQWQVNASAACTVELSFDNIDFIPAAAPPGDGGTAAD